MFQVSRDAVFELVAIILVIVGFVLIVTAYFQNSFLYGITGCVSILIALVVVWIGVEESGV